MSVTPEDMWRYQNGEIHGQAAQKLFLQNYGRMNAQERQLLQDRLDREQIEEQLAAIQSRVPATPFHP